jgi:hypothetical protein
MVLSRLRDPSHVVQILWLHACSDLGEECVGMESLCCSGLTPSLVGNAVSWGLYWIAWKSINQWWCTHYEVPELTWNMKLVCGMQAGESPTGRGKVCN